MTPQLNLALAKAKAQFPVILAKRNVSIPTKAGREINFTYAELEEIAQAVTPTLSSNGLVVVHQMQFVESKFCLVSSRGVLPDGQMHEVSNYIVVEDNFHDRQNNDYIVVASEPLYREDVEQIIAGEVELIDFELTEEYADYYSEEAWEDAQKLVEDDWKLILEDLE